MLKKQDILEKSHKQQIKSEVMKRKALLREANLSDERITKLEEDLKVEKVQFSLSYKNKKFSRKKAS